MQLWGRGLQKFWVLGTTTLGGGEIDMKIFLPLECSVVVPNLGAVAATIEVLKLRVKKMCQCSTPPLLWVGLFVPP